MEELARLLLVAASGRGDTGEDQIIKGALVKELGSSVAGAGFLMTVVVQRAQSLLNRHSQDLVAQVEGAVRARKARAEEALDPKGETLGIGE